MVSTEWEVQGAGLKALCMLPALCHLHLLMPWGDSKMTLGQDKQKSFLSDVTWHYGCFPFNTGLSVLQKGHPLHSPSPFTGRGHGHLSLSDPLH